MKKYLLVSVTWEDIEWGIGKSVCRCPVALSIARTRSTIPHVSGKVVFLGHGPLLKLPEKAARFVEDFDLGRPVKPFRFWLAS